MDPNLAPKLAPNGTLKKHNNNQHPIIRHPQSHPTGLYRECLRNHAASLGGHAVDGCGEFMPSPSSVASDPSSLTCAACGCHRNFHRRIPEISVSDSQEINHQDLDDVDDFDDDGDGEEYEEEEEEANTPSAPHMLLALSTGLPADDPAKTNGGGGGGGGGKKRFRSRFSPEQKERMQELSERLGWRMQRREDAAIEAACREIGVGKGVFKVWMHNNKHHHHHKIRPSSTLPPPPISPNSNNNNNNSNHQDFAS